MSTPPTSLQVRLFLAGVFAASVLAGCTAPTESGGCSSERAAPFAIDQGSFDPNGRAEGDGRIVYDSADHAHSFMVDGIYHGKPFVRDYSEGGRTIMAARNVIQPLDGVLETSLIVRINEPDVTARIYLDEDWRRAVGDATNVVVGSANATEAPMAWDQAAPCVYEVTVTQPVADRFARDAPEHGRLDIRVLNVSYEALNTGPSKDVVGFWYR